MFIDLNQPLTVDEKIPVCLIFKEGSYERLEVVVKNDHQAKSQSGHSQYQCIFL